MVRIRRRSGRPPSERPYRCNTSQRIIRNRSVLLETINGFYGAALDLLPVEEMPALVPRLLKAGLCLGFSDPVSNIIVNTVSYSRRVPHRKSLYSGKTKMGARKKALSRAVADTSDVKYWPPLRPLLRDMPIAMRSLEALVAFLTFYFRYLPVSEALEYLRLAKGDHLTAVRLIEEDRNSSGGFSFASRTTKTALKCAALAAWHPKPRALVNRSYSLASRMEKVSQHLLPTDSGSLSCSAIETINGLLMKPRHKLQSLARVTPPQFLQEKKEQPPFVLTKSLQSTLLDKICGLYLDAVARLPMGSNSQVYHQALLKAGHCYGPAENPVYNIVLNTLWYKAMSPLQVDLSVAMICSRSLVHVACRSLRGLVAYLCAGFPMISEHQAMRYLLLTEVSLWGAIELARGEGHAERSTLDQDSAYLAAATAAQHPDPDALVDFFVSTFPRMPLSSTLHVPQLSEMLIRYCSATYGSDRKVAVLSEGGFRILSLIHRDFRKDERFAVRKVLTAMRKYREQTKGPVYELHNICGLNSNIGNSYVFGLHYGPGHFHPRETQYSHINFLARLRDSSDAVPILFFVECSNNEDVADVQCYPVDGHPGRCFYCENEGAKIVHPDLKKYIGRDIAFERMACKDLGGLTVDDSGDKLIADSADICEEDCIYFDANRDVKCAEFMNARAGIFERSFLV